MAKCNDCWCEHYDKNKGNCDQCLKNESMPYEHDLNVIISRRANRQMEIDKKDKSVRQGR
jgi:hypothetical protein